VETRNAVGVREEPARDGTTLPDPTIGTNAPEQHPTPHPDGVVDVLARHPNGLTITEMVGMVGESDTQIRRALAQLAAAGAVASRKDPPVGRGRPTMRFRLVPTTNTWARVALVLLDVIATEGIDEATIRTAAQTQGAALLAATSAKDLFGAMGELGFAPRDVSAPADLRAGRTRLEFLNCPLRDGVLAQGGHAICAAHHGLAEGMCSVSGSEVAEFVVRDPVRVGCRVTTVGR
jgi:predicted ArsR family transcriptional regulator